MTDTGPFPPLLGLLVAGGQSTRMGTDKAFLPYPILEPTPVRADDSNDDGSVNGDVVGVGENKGRDDAPGDSPTQSAWLRLLAILLQVCPEGVVISHNPTQTPRMRTELDRWLASPQGRAYVGKAHLMLDSEETKDIGPAAALITAHSEYPGKGFLVVAVDFPFITRQTLEVLVERYREPVGAYFHPVDMHPEPLLSVWSSAALERLRRNALEGTSPPTTTSSTTAVGAGAGRKRTGPCYTMKELWREQGGEVVGRWGVLPRSEGELRNTNTREEWDRAVEELIVGRLGV